MTVSTTNSVYSYDGDGVTVAFSFPRYAQSSAQIAACVTDETTGAETTPSYTVTGSASSWTVTFATAPASTTKVAVYRDPSVVQETNFSSEGDPLAAMTAKADLLTMQLQALRNRGLRMSNGTLQDFDPIVPNPLVAAGFSLTVNDDGDGLVWRQELSGATVSSEMSPVVTGTLANALALLGAASISALTTAGGTTAFTLTTGRSLAAYTSGLSFVAKMNATNTGASTLNVDGLGAKNIYKRSGSAISAVVAGDLVSGAFYRFDYDGTQFVAAVAGGLTGVATQVFTGSGTYTPTAGMRYCIIECLGGGGGGGGVASSGGSGAAGGGGAGGYSRKLATAANVGTSQTVTIGAAGAVGSAGNNNGGAGGDTSVGTLCVGKGASGGGGAAASSAGAPGAGGVAGTGDVTATGENGSVFGANATAYGTAAVAFVGGRGGSSRFGSGANGGVASVGGNATGYGSGGGGAASHNSSGNHAGGAATAGLVIITEFF